MSSKIINKMHIVCVCLVILYQFNQAVRVRWYDIDYYEC